MRTRRNRTIIAGLILFLVAFALGKFAVTDNLKIPADVKQAMASLPDKLDYNIHVKKILSDKCFSCHGPDAKKQKGELRLDIADVAYNKEAESGLKAIKPSSISNSEVAHRILSDDKEYCMPTLLIFRLVPKKKQLFLNG